MSLRSQCIGLVFLLLNSKINAGAQLIIASDRPGLVKGIHVVNPGITYIETGIEYYEAGVSRIVLDCLQFDVNGGVETNTGDLFVGMGLAFVF